MKGVGKTVMVGTKLEEFGAEVLGVMKDVSPGRDMVLCRLDRVQPRARGNHPGNERQPHLHRRQARGRCGLCLGIRQRSDRGRDSFPADDSVCAGQRPADRRGGQGSAARQGIDAAGVSISPTSIDGGRATGSVAADIGGPLTVSGGGLAGMTPIVTPLAASGFSPRALALLDARLRPLGMAPMAGGAAPEHVIRAEADRPLVPGAPLSIAHGHRRFRPLGYRHGDARRGQSRLRLRPSHVQPGRLRISDDDRLHPHGLSPRQRQLEDGLAAEDRRRHQCRREHLRRRPARAQARPAADERSGEDRPLRRLTGLPGADRSRANAPAFAAHGCADQRDRYGGQSA